MEDTDTTQFKKRNDEDFLIFIEDCNLKNSLEQDIHGHGFYTTEERNHSHVIIRDLLDEGLQVQYQTEILISSPKNLHLFLTHIKADYLNQGDNKKLDFHFKKQKKYITSILDAPFFALNTFAHHSNSLIDFCQTLFSDSFFKAFSSFYLFTHRKGLSSAKLNYITTESNSTKDLTTTEFNKLFSAIKKSKNGSFGHATLKGANFNIVGTCLAKEFSLKGHNVIFIISKDEFIPQSDSDIFQYEAICDYLPYFFNVFLAKEIYLHQMTQNKRFISMVSNSESLDPKMYKDDERLSYFLSKIQEDNFNILDVNHKERISLLGELLNTLKHELSNPLFGLELSAEILETENLPDDSEDFVYEIKLAIHRCQDIISNFSDIFMEGSPIKALNLIKLINEVLTLTKSKSKHIKKNITLNTSPLKSTDELIIKTNKTILAQIIFNLIINSTQALGENHLAPEISIDITTKDHFTEILVSDNGPGLSEEIISKIFIPFFTTKEHGTGLGLSICKNLIHKLSGDIKYLKSDKGASFLIKLPNEYPTH